jgi:hypothetical protein
MANEILAKSINAIDDNNFVYNQDDIKIAVERDGNVVFV